MTRVDFYVNANAKAEIARKLVAKAYKTGSHVLIHIDNRQRAEEMVHYLWTAQTLSFLPHVLCDHPLAASTPILVGSEPVNIARADVLINLSTVTPKWFSRFDRILEIVGQDTLDKEQGRARFRLFKEMGYLLDVHDVSGEK